MQTFRIRVAVIKFIMRYIRMFLNELRGVK